MPRLSSSGVIIGVPNNSSVPLSTALNPLVPKLTALCRQAGEAIEATRRAGARTRYKEDDSPVTQADLAAHEILSKGLARIGEASWQVLSEESPSIPWQERYAWSTYWLVDPLDGTKEYLRGSDEYSVNVSLIHDHRSVLGVVEKPRTGEVWVGIPGRGAWYQSTPEEEWRCIQVAPSHPPRFVISRFHRGDRTQRLIDATPGARVETLGSSLKCCLIADGRADVYPRFGPTSEWDTAAAQAVLEGAGGALVDIERWAPLRYNTREGLLNPAFVACASLDGSWRTDWPE